MSSNLAFVVLGAGILAAIAVTAIKIAQLGMQPKCPLCGGKEIIESSINDLTCKLCGFSWRDTEPKRFGRYHADL
jgi:hypothetical protein